MKKDTTAHKTALVGILGALALVLSFMENVLMPSVGFLPPGAKPGLANVVTMFTAATLGAPYTIFIVLIKAVFALLTRGFTAFLMSLVGGVFSFAVLTVAFKVKSEKVSLVGIGILSACAHNLGQMCVSVALLGSGAVLSYLPNLLIFGTVTGFITGTIVRKVVSHF